MPKEQTLSRQEGLLDIAGKSGYYQLRLLAFCCVVGMLAGVLSHALPHLFWMPDFWRGTAPPVADLFAEVGRRMVSHANKARVARRLSVVTANLHLPNIGKHYENALVVIMLVTALGWLLLVPLAWLSGRRLGHGLYLGLLLAAALVALFNSVFYVSAAAFGVALLAAGALFPTALHHFWESSGGELRALGPAAAHFSFTIGALLVVSLNCFAKNYRVTYGLVVVFTLCLMLRLGFLRKSPAQCLRRGDVVALRETLATISKENNTVEDHAEAVAEIGVAVARGDATLLGDREESFSRAVFARTVGAALLNAHFAFAYFTLCFSHQLYKGEFSDFPAFALLAADLLGGLLALALLARLPRKAVLIPIIALTMALSATQFASVSSLLAHRASRQMLALAVILSLRFLVCAASGVGFAYQMELVPSAQRGLSLLLAALFARLYPISAVSQLVKARYERTSQLSVFVFSALPALVAAIALPETRGKRGA